MSELEKWLSGNQANLESGIREAIAYIFGVGTELSPTAENSIYDAAIKTTLDQTIKNVSIPKVADTVVAWINENLMPLIRKPAMAILETLVKNGVINQQMKAVFTKMFDQNNIISVVSLVFSLGAALMEYVKGNASIVMTLKQQELAQSLRPYLPDAGSIMNAPFIDPSKTKRVRETLARSGISEEDIDIIFQSNYKSYDENTIRDLYLRGEIDETRMYNRMRELHYTDGRIKDIVKTWNVLPGPQDIIRFAVREAFSPSQISGLGLDKNYPGELTEWGKKIGLPESVCKLFWYSHWELPSPQMAYEMLHRGLITDKELDDLLVALDFSPRWHEALKGISYNLVTRVDARRLYQRGVWDDKKLLEWFKKAGYTEEDARDMTSWAKMEYAQEDKEVSLGTVLDSYQSGIIKRPEAEGLIKSLGYSDDRVQWLLNLSDYKEAADSRRQIIGGTKKLFTDGQITALDSRTRLGQAGIDADYIEALISNWEAEVIVNEKIPSKSDVDRFFKAKIYSEDQYENALKKLGYNDTDISAYVKLNEAKEEENAQPRYQINTVERGEVNAENH